MVEVAIIIPVIEAVTPTGIIIVEEPLPPTVLVVDVG
ncbi:hypothetical protein A2U01_0063881, partial [Trifolium medium]|nr:hypothetical protein [Trifolium medium]